MEHSIHLADVTEKQVHPLSDRFYGKDEKNGREISFTNYYMQLNGEPFMGVMGECHYARVSENQWEDTILKMKMGGINIISTYIFWIHHEEEEGIFRFDGNRNIRKFVELCARHGMYVVIRCGPFDHGEVRNGGLPDWLYGKPFEVRSANDGFLHYTRRLYHNIAEQLKGLFFRDGGPIIGAQLDNEYMHSASPWEITTGITNEWVPGGSEGDAYILRLKEIAQEEGIVTPFYTCTGWGGAATPSDETLPLLGGYAFWPWIFYDYRGEHPATPEYIYRDFHNNEIPKTYNFEPAYEPEKLPYACCEMGGGMQVYYYYRFQLPFESVDAMANIKLAGGCNFLGYYMYRGGTNPKGKRAPFLNECQCPKLSYDYQAPVGEFGQLRPSYFRLKALHYFAEAFKSELVRMRTVLPEGAEDIAPEDVETLRWNIRTDGKSGFIFLNNYQDHAACRDKQGETIQLRLRDETITIPGLSPAAGEEAVLPFNVEICGHLLKYATAQPLTSVKTDNETVWFFFEPAGMKAQYVWADGEETHEGLRIVTLTREQSLEFSKICYHGKEYALLSDAPLIFDGETFSVESGTAGKKASFLMSYPGLPFRMLPDGVSAVPAEEGLFRGIRILWDDDPFAATELPVTKTGMGRYVFELPALPERCKDVILEIDYRGDVGHLFHDGELLSDNFSNDAVWEVGLKEVLADPGRDHELTILITPKKKNAGVVSSTMAGRLEQLASAVEELRSVRLRAVREAAVGL